jgi:hypothetical protein
MANKALATQLRELERDGLVSRTVCDNARRSVRYAPTEEGRAMQPVIRTLVEWGNRRLEQAETARAMMEGLTSRTFVETQFNCNALQLLVLGPEFRAGRQLRGGKQMHIDVTDTPPEKYETVDEMKDFRMACRPARG